MASMATSWSASASHRAAVESLKNEEQQLDYVGFDGKRWEVHKFGGTSVANAECFLMVASIVEEQLGIKHNSPSPSEHGSNSNGSVSNSHGRHSQQNCNGRPKNLAVVVSAMGGKPKVTDLLLSTVKAAAERDEEGVNSILQHVLEKHFACIEALPLDDAFKAAGESRSDDEIPPSQKLKEIITSDIADLRDILKTVSLMKWQATRISELVSGFGELWSSQILTALLSSRAKLRNKTVRENSSSSLHDIDDREHHFVFLDARRVITIDEEAIQHGAVCWDISHDKLRDVYGIDTAKTLPADDANERHSMHFVVTGYVASNTQGVATTLQRDGSDYSAAIMGRLLQATNITIWTDVDGVLSADPRRVPTANVIPEVSYNEAMELAYFGAKVIHPKTMQPAIMADPQIPIYIRNTFHSAFRGTRIYTTSTTHTDRERCVCGFSSIENMALINVEGSGLVGVHGVAKRLFGTLEGIGVNVVLISQASSEHSITFATMAEQAHDAKVAIEEEFHKELKLNHITEVVVKSPCSIIAAVGDGMSKTTGVSGRFFSALGDAKINVLAISQGCSERNISAVVLTSESSRALRAVHAAFHLSHTVVRVGVVGMNELGMSLLRLLEAQRNKLRNTFEIDLQVCAVVADACAPNVVKLKRSGSTDSITSLAYDAAISPVNREPSVAFDPPIRSDIAVIEMGGIESLCQQVLSEDCAHTVIFDCTNDEHVGKMHPAWLNAGVNVVTANNTGLSGSREIREAISIAESHRGLMSAEYLREVTVGGGLPIITSLRDLLSSGDKIRHLDGILSVCWSYIMFRIAPPPGVCDCSDFDELLSKGVYRGDHDLSPTKKIGKPCTFSEAVQEAIDLGLMEDDPVKDLSNEYTARILMVLAKELGIDDSYDVRRIQHLSEQLVPNGTTVEEYKQLTVELDKQMTERVAKAAERGCVPRYISSIDVKSGFIELKIIDVPCNHVFAVTPPSNACVRFFTQRHKYYPLIVQGPAAGADSTASALLAELLRLMRTKVGPRTGTLSRTASSTFLV